MAVTKLTYVTCNGCGANDLPDMEHDTAAEIREELRKEFGWVRRGSLDFCPICKGEFHT